MKIEVSLGEAIDRLTILEIKLERIKDPGKVKNVQFEYELLRRSIEREGIAVDPKDLAELKAVNMGLWETEDRLRQKQRDRRFDEEFVELAKSVYLQNDRRFEIKARINRRTGSKIIEEKEYVDYPKGEST